MDAVPHPPNDGRQGAGNASHRHCGHRRCQLASRPDLLYASHGLPVLLFCSSPTCRYAEDLIEAPGPEAQEAEAHVLEGHPPSALAEFAESQGTGLIVMASHGRTGLKRLLMGSVAERVVRQAPCPVFVAKSYGKSVLPGLEAEAD